GPGQPNAVHCFYQAEDGIRDRNVTGVQTCALPISLAHRVKPAENLDIGGIVTNETALKDNGSALRTLSQGAERGKTRQSIASKMAGIIRPASAIRFTATALSRYDR